MDAISLKMTNTMHIGSQRQATMKIPQELLQISKDRWNDALVGCIYTDQELNKEEVLSALRSRWKFGKKLEVLFHPKNRIIVRCDKPMERLKLLKEQPWTLLGHLIFFKVYDHSIKPEEISFSSSTMWIGFSGLLLEHELPQIIRIIASAAGEVLEIYPTVSSQRPTGGFKAKVLVQLDHPLVQGGYADTIQQGYVWISYRYLGLPYYYCTNCCCLGHIASTCAKESSQPSETLDLIASVGGDSDESIHQNSMDTTADMQHNLQESDGSHLQGKDSLHTKNKGKSLQAAHKESQDDTIWLNKNPLAQIFGDNASKILGQVQTVGESSSIAHEQPSSRPKQQDISPSPSSLLPKSTSQSYRGRPPRFGPRKDLLHPQTSLVHTATNMAKSSRSLLSKKHSPIPYEEKCRPFKKRKLIEETVMESSTDTLMEPYHPLPPSMAEEDRSMIVQNSARSSYSMDLISDIIANPEVQSILLAQGLSIQPVWGDSNILQNFVIPIQVETSQMNKEENLGNSDQQEDLTVEDYGTADTSPHQSICSTRTKSTQGFIPYQHSEVIAINSHSQYEGAVAEDGRTPSIWDVYTHDGYMPDKSNGDIASDGYHKYKEDVKMMSDIGLEAYRFSISWSRLLPYGRGAINPKGQKYYNNLIDELVSHRIEPHVTLYHLDLPQTLEEEYGGWLSPKIIEDFTAYADVCFREFGDRVSHWTSLNEPNIISAASYGTGQFAPRRCSQPGGIFNCTAGNSSVEPYLATHNLLLAHASAAALYREKYQANQKGLIGINVYAMGCTPMTNSTADMEATQRVLDFYIGWIMDPVVFGDYPKIMKTNVGSRIPSFTKRESELVKGSFDFIGINHYITAYVKDNSQSTPNTGPGDFGSDMRATYSVTKEEKPPGPFIPTSVPYNPSSLQNLLEYFMDKYDNPPVYIHEHGFGTPYNETLNDTAKIHFISGYIGSILDAIRNGTNTRGYFIWSFLDVFELITGYQRRLGIVHVDFEHKNLKREPKSSAQWYSNFIKNCDRVMKDLENDKIPSRIFHFSQ